MNNFVTDYSVIIEKKLESPPHDDIKGWIEVTTWTIFLFSLFFFVKKTKFLINQK